MEPISNITERRIIEFRLIEETSTGSLNNEVNRLLRDGFELRGFVEFHSPKAYRDEYRQTMVKYEE